MKGKSTLLIVVAAIAGALLFASVFYVDEREKAIVFKFGEIVNSDLKPGLHFKIPFINNVRYFDARVQTMDADPELYLTGEKKNLVVDSFVKWRIRDVHQYYTRLQGSQANAFNSRDNLMVLDPSSDFFRYFKQVDPGAAGGAEVTATGN